MFITDAMNKAGYKKKNADWLWAFIINVGLLLAVLATTDVMYETNDDFQVAKEIAEGYPFVGFVNYYLCKTLIAVNKLFPEHNAFVISQIVLSFVSFVVVLKIVICRCKFKQEIVLATAICALFSLDHYSCIQFTKTAALLMTAGLIWLADNYTHERKVISFGMASVLYIVGAAYRQKVMLPTIAFFACYLAIWIVLNNDSEKGKHFKKEAIWLALIIIVVLVPYGTDYMSDSMNISTPELKNARSYQSERTRVTDYPLLKYYDEMDNASKAYDEAGLSRNDLYLVTRFVLDYDGAASAENLKRINEINTPFVKESKSIIKSTKKALKSAFVAVKNIEFIGMHIIICAIMAALIFITNTRKASLYTAFIAIGSVLLYISVYYIQRPQYRALYVVDISAALWLLYINASEEKRNKTKHMSILLIAFSVLVATLLHPGLKALESHHNYNETITDDAVFEDYLKNNEDKLFVKMETIMKQPTSYLTPLLRPTYPINLTGTGGWETLSPYKKSQLQQYGIENPIKDIINNHNAYILGNYKIDSLLEYYNKWYCESGESIELVKVDNRDEEDVFQVIRN